MITLRELEPIVKRVVKDLDKIASDMSSYRKIKTDLRARSLINSINERISQINLAYETYMRPDLYNLYGHYDFTDWVKTIEAYVPEYRKTYERIMRFENVVEYY